MWLRIKPNLKCYKEKKDFIFIFPLILNDMRYLRFQLIQRCMHVTNPTGYAHILWGQVGYNNMRQVRWLVDEI